MCILCTRCRGCDVIGALVHHPKTHVFQYRNTFRQRQRARQAPDFEANRALLLLQPVMEIDGERARLAQGLDHADIAGRHRRRIGFLEADGERVAVAGEQRARLVRRIDQRQRVAQPVGPRAHDGRDFALQRGTIDRRHVAAGAADDEVHAHQRAFREERIERRDAPDEGAGEVVADPRADVAVVAFARYEHQHRHEAVEAVAPRQHAHARPFVELQDGEGEMIERVFFDLKQFVARIVLQHVGQCFAGMTAWVEAGARFDARDLAAQIGNAVRGARIGGGGEQPDDALLAHQIAGRIEALDADIVEIDAPVHVGVDIGLGDDQQPRFLEERHDFRGEFDQLVAVLEHAQFTQAHDAERAVKVGFQRLAVEGVIAHAEEGEIVGQQPLQELDRLGDLIHRQRRRVGLEIGDDAVGALEHGAPVLHRQSHFAEHARERAHDVGARGVVRDRLEMDMDEALARAGGRIDGAERDKFCAVAPHAEHRMRHQLHIEPALGDLAHHRVDQERHVVVDDLDHRDRLALARFFQRHGLAADLRRARRPVFEKIERPLGQFGEIGGRVAQHILRHRAGVELRDERRRDVAAARSKRGAGLLDDGAGGVFMLAGGKFNGHGSARGWRESVEHKLEFSPSAASRREHHTIW